MDAAVNLRLRVSNTENGRVSHDSLVVEGQRIAFNSKTFLMDLEPVERKPLLLKIADLLGTESIGGVFCDNSLFREIEDVASRKFNEVAVLKTPSELNAYVTQNASPTVLILICQAAIYLDVEAVLSEQAVSYWALRKIAEDYIELIPERCFLPIEKNIYPIPIPRMDFKPNLDLILVDCPARNLSMMPNGLGYVHNALKNTDISFQTYDLDIVCYHKFHMHRLYDEGGVVTLPSGAKLPVDPWEAEHYDAWTSIDGNKDQLDGVLAHFLPIISEFANHIIEASPKMLALSIQSCSEAFSTELVQRVKDKLPGLIVIVGGFSCYNPKIGFKAFPLADYMCIGEADLTVAQLVSAIAKGERPKDIPGVLAKDDTPDRLFIPAPMENNLDKLQDPRYEWFPLSIYRNWNGYQLTPVIASRGCRWSRCTFCAERFYWRIRDPKKFVDELEYLVSQGCYLFMFNESDLNGAPELVLEICDEIIRRGLKIKLTAQLRIHKKSDKAFFEKLKKAGFVALRFGVDAFSENTLRLQKKGYTKDTVRQNLKDCWESGIYTEVNWVIGVPGETDEDCAEGVEFILENKSYIGRVANINPLILVNGSVYWIDPEAHGIRFREEIPEETFNEIRVVPSNAWYSVEPYIDAAVRKKRFENIVFDLVSQDFPLGSWAEKIYQEVKSNRDMSRSVSTEAWSHQ